jgi:putative restriction endonuclease
VVAATDFDDRLRRQAFTWLEGRTHDGLVAITSTELLEFRFDGAPFRLMAAQQGIWKPRQLNAALSIRTAYTPLGATRPYEDMFGLDGVIHYKWRGTDPDHFENRALRVAMELQRPLIWFVGVGQATYLPRFPVYLVSEDAQNHQFIGTFDELRDLVAPHSVIDDRMRRYLMVETRRRLHQPVFRATVMQAYETRCAVCALRHGQLLDAAHIIADSAEAGIPSVRNGLALCKIHHAAFDTNILGIRPDHIVDIRDDLLHEVDGPMLEHGLQERHGQRLMKLPTRRTDKPDPTALEQRYAEFRAAG